MPSRLSPRSSHLARRSGSLSWRARRVWSPASPQRRRGYGTGCWRGAGRPPQRRQDCVHWLAPDGHADRTGGWTASGPRCPRTRRQVAAHRLRRRRSRSNSGQVCSPASPTVAWGSWSNRICIRGLSGPRSQRSRTARRTSRRAGYNANWKSITCSAERWSLRRSSVSASLRIRRSRRASTAPRPGCALR